MLAVVGAYVGYAALKLAGYTLAAMVLRRLIAPSPLSSIRIGLVRTVLGIVAGGAYSAVWLAAANHGMFEKLPLSSGRAGPALWYLVGLIPVRALEWGWLVWYAFDRQFARQGRDTIGIGLGIVWSFVLDLPAIAGAWMFVASIC